MTAPKEKQNGNIEVVDLVIVEHEVRAAHPFALLLTILLHEPPFASSSFG